MHEHPISGAAKAAGDATARDGDVSPIPIMDYLPATRKFLDILGLDFFPARIACNDPDSWLWEHRDHIELRPEKRRHRLHVPLVSNDSHDIRYIWYLDESGNSTRLSVMPTRAKGVSIVCI